ncbi:MAG TPA: hypothetical protein VJ276_04390 [Thermoanaerobaculia bacterium]|nr:hypothetical protein [Thermoanaerobaculia bacterium]
MSTEYLRQAAILGAFVEKVRSTGLPCGETLLQKAAYVMKELFGVPLSDEFRIHYYGPFSFQLRNRLSLLEAEEFLRVSPRDLGVTYDTGERFSQLREQLPATIAQHQQAIDFAASKLGSLGVKELEPLTTALFVTRQQPKADAGARAARLMQIKPHVKSAEARAAIAKVDAWIAQTAS